MTFERTPESRNLAGSLTRSAKRVPKTKLRKQSIFLALILALWVLCIGAGCAHRHIEKHSPLSLEDESIQRLLSKWESMGSERKALRARLKVRQAGMAGLFARATIDLTLKKPRRLYANMRALFDQPIKVMAIDQDQVRLLDLMGEPAFYEGPLTEQSLERLFGFPISTSIFEALLFQYPASDWLRQSVVAQGSDSYGVTYTDSQTQIHLKTDLDGHIQTWRLSDSQGNLVFRAEAAWPKGDSLNTARHPKELRLFIEESDLEVIVELTDYQFNPPINDALFQLSPPPNTPRYRL